MALNLSAGSLTWTETPSPANGSHWTQALAVFAASTPLTWTGAAGSGGNANWNTTDFNWSNSSTSSTTYLDGNPLTFPDVANTNLTISGSVSPGAITFTNAIAAYTFSGGTIGGAASITVSGGGSVILSNTNNYSGFTNVSNGFLQMHSPGALPAASSIGVSGGTLDLGSNTFTKTPPISFSGGVVQNGSLVYTGTYSVTAGTVSANLGGLAAPSSMAGAGTFLSGSNTYSGATTISSGTLQLGNAAALLNSTVTVMPPTTWRLARASGPSTWAGSPATLKTSCWPTPAAAL